jgi:hypothetical protein
VWLITGLGFFSIARKPDDVGAGTLTIRARVKSDLESLRQHCLPGLGKIEENAGTLSLSREGTAWASRRDACTNGAGYRLRELQK